VLTFTLEICNDAAMQLSDKGKLMLALNGIPALSQVTIDGLDHPVSSPIYIRYESKYVNANVGKDFDIDAAYAVALPTDHIKALELHYVNGKNIKFSEREIKQILVNAQDPIYDQDGKTIYGWGKFSVISVEDVLTMRITLDVSTNFFLLKNQAI
jgi:hypothetical protein